MLISMLVNHMKVRVKYAYMLNKSSLDISEEIILSLIPGKVCCVNDSVSFFWRYEDLF